MKIVSYGRVNDGKLHINQRREFDKDLTLLNGKDVVVTIEKRKKTRSIFQNRYYWGVIVPLVKEGLLNVGYELTTDQVHEFLKGQFNVIEIVNERSGEILKSIGSTTEMTTSKMMEYFAQITRWASEYLNVRIPEPNEQLEITA